MGAHAKYAPSDSDRWLSCDAALSEFPKLGGEDTVYSLEGTNAHQLLEDCLLEGADPSSYIGTELFEKATGKFAGKPELDSVVSKDMADHIQAVQLYIYDRFENGYPNDECQLWTEAKVEINALCSGTMDVALYWSEAKVLEVIDLKYGRGVIVSPDSPQLKIYANGVIQKRKLKPKKVLLTIAQPRGFSKEGPIRTEEFHNYAEHFSAVIDRVEYLENLPLEGRSYGPSDKACRWCSGRNTCKGRDSVLFDKAKELFEKEDPVKSEPDKVTPKVRWLAEHGDSLVDEVNAAKAMLLQHVLRDGPSHGYKAVLGRANRIWAASPEVVKEALRHEYRLRVSDFTQSKLLGIPAIEKVVKKLKPDKVKDLKDLIVKPQGSPKLVLDSSPGKPIIENAESMFEEFSSSESEFDF
jgi:hypothetical protein